MEKIFQVEGMMCAGCEKRVNTALSAIDGVIKCEANASSNSVSIVFDDTKVTEDMLVSTIEDTGYDVIK